MYQHILLPVELGGAGDIGRAHQAARTLMASGGKITLLHVVEPIPTYVEPYMPDDLRQKSVSLAKERLSEMAADLGIENSTVIEGSAGRGIVDWADKTGVDCIVVASHRPALSDIVLGSTAAWVVRHCPCAVHVVR